MAALAVTPLLLVIPLVLGSARRLGPVVATAGFGPLYLGLPPIDGAIGASRITALPLATTAAPAGCSGVRFAHSTS